MVISRSSKSQSEYSDFETYFATANNYHHYSYTGLKSAKRLLRNIFILELKYPRGLTFYFAKSKFLIHGTRSRHLLLKLNTFVN